MKTSEILSLVLIFCFSIFTIELYAQAPNFIWTKRAGGVEGDYGHSIAVDSTGNSFIAGHFYGIVKFDTITLTSTGGYDLFIAKYDSSGNVLWAKQVGGIGYVEGNSIVIDKRGNSFITGYFDNSVAFETTILNSYGGEDIFIAKYNPSGKILWVKKVGGIENDCGEEISIDGSGNLYLTGSFWGTANFDNVSLTSRNGSDTFAAKYDSLGNLIWVKQPSGIGSAVGKGIATDKVGNSVVTGFFERTATFGTITLTSGSIHWPDFFIAKYDSAGNVLWAKQAGGNYTVEGSDIAINESGESIVMGSFENTVTFGNTTFTTSGNKDIFIV